MVIYWSPLLKVGVSGLAISILGGVWIILKKLNGGGAPRLALIGVCILLIASIATILVSPAKVVSQRLSSSGEDGD